MDSWIAISAGAANSGGAVAESPAVIVEPRFAGSRLAAGRTERLTFRLLDAATGEPLVDLKDVRALLIEPVEAIDADGSSGPAGLAPRRKWATPAGDRTAGIYQVDWLFPRPGLYGLAVSVASLGLGFADHAPTAIAVAGSHAHP